MTRKGRRNAFLLDSKVTGDRKGRDLDDDQDEIEPYKRFEKDE